MDRDDKIMMVLGEVRSDVRNQNKRIRRMDRNIDVIRNSVQAQGIRMASLQCDARGKQISDLYKALGKEEESTQQIRIQLAEQTAVKRWWSGVGGAIWGTKSYWIPWLVVAAGATVAVIFGS